MSRRPVPVILSLIVLLAPAANVFAGGPQAAAALDALPSPAPSSLLGVLDAEPSAWRTVSLEVFRWDRFPDIVIVDSASFAVQDRLFTRMAYYLEKRGYRGRLLSNSELVGRHGWNAHDYGAAGLAGFFTAAADCSFPLNPEEIALRRLSLQEGIVVTSRAGYAPGRGGILGISRSSSRVERELLLTHESFHGVFFSSAAYREFCQALWDSLSPGLRSFYERFLGSLGYDISAPTLVVNEFQAYLMQQPLAYAEFYFQRFVAALQSPGSPPVTPWQLLGNAERLDAFTREAFGFGAGGPLLASLGSESR